MLHESYDCLSIPQFLPQWEIVPQGVGLVLNAGVFPIVCIHWGFVQEVLLFVFHQNPAPSASCRSSFPARLQAESFVPFAFLFQRKAQGRLGTYQPPGPYKY